MAATADQSRYFHHCPRPRCSHGEVSTRSALPITKRCPLHDVEVRSEPLIVVSPARHVCGAECTGARRGKCECECGGEFHGVQRLPQSPVTAAQKAAAFARLPGGGVPDDEPW